MSMFMQALFEGIINGSTLALVAMGIALVGGYGYPEFYPRRISDDCNVLFLLS